MMAQPGSRLIDGRLELHRRGDAHRAERPHWSAWGWPGARAAEDPMEASRKVACSGCGTMLPPAFATCPVCRAPRPPDPPPPATRRPSAARRSLALPLCIAWAASIPIAILAFSAAVVLSARWALGALGITGRVPIVIPGSITAFVLGYVLFAIGRIRSNWLILRDRSPDSPDRRTGGDIGGRATTDRPFRRASR